MTDADAILSAAIQRFYGALPPQSPPVAIVPCGPVSEPTYTMPDGRQMSIPEAIQCGQQTMRDTMRTIR
jgi:hypothetical protein